MAKHRIVILDGQGGGLGRAIVERLRRELGDSAELIAVGTNAFAAQAMLKAGADASASGESAVIYNCRHAGLIVGPIGIVAAGSMLGELSPAMALAIAESPGVKVLMPLNRCGLQVVGVTDEPLQTRLDQLAALVLAHLAMGDAR